MSRSTLIVDGPLDVAATLRTSVAKAVGRIVGHGSETWWVQRTPTGAVSLRIERHQGRVEAEAFGPGSGWALEHLPDLLGVDDDPSRFRPPPGPLRDLHGGALGMRLGRSGLVFGALLAAILAQRVTAEEAHGAYLGIVRSYGEPAPGPLPAMVPPGPGAIAALGYQDLHRFGVERARAVTLIEAARRMGRLEAVIAMDRADGYRRLQAVRGIGPWTAAIVMGAACGDPDAVPVGDYHLPSLVAWVLAGQPRATDERMLELLEPYRGHRRRVIALLERSGIHPPGFGPRVARRRIAAS
ncbi:MAG: DNA-3-methyladenine glycosylase 2 family protein [Actinomycetota bacterium]|nr:DNA-3-methyladenine glycosylase 2 family protein [Actinomycetota bacterium]